jgi:hypothetical protein
LCSLGMSPWELEIRPVSGAVSITTTRKKPVVTT